MLFYEIFSSTTKSIKQVMSVNFQDGKMCKNHVTFGQVSWRPGVKINHQKAKKKVPSGPIEILETLNGQGFI